jgi:D-alanyl-D-alanine carboxypeptidase
MRSWKCYYGVSGESDIRYKALAGAMAGWLAMAAVAIAARPSLASARVHASIVVDVQAGKTLEAHNADRLCYPASLAKLMTLYITFQELSLGKMTLDQELRVSSHAAAQAPTKLYLRPGEQISVRSAVLAVTTRSANDVAVVLAEAAAGSEWKFAQLMNQEARELGMNHTTFRNASGLPNPRQQTTARDMSRLALAILHDFPQYYHFFNARSFDFRGKMIYGHDNLLGRYPGVDGMKTGYTDASGFNIVTSVVRHDRRLLGVVMGGRSARSRDSLMIALLNRGFALIQAGTVTAATHEKTATHSAAMYEKVSEQDPEDDEASSPDVGWIVQIGGKFATARQVRLALKSALHTAPRRLKDARPLVVELRGRRYLARFSDMSEATALDACQVLRRRKFTCNASQVRRSGIVLASASR